MQESPGYDDAMVTLRIVPVRRIPEGVSGAPDYKFCTENKLAAFHSETEPSDYKVWLVEMGFVKEAQQQAGY